METKRHCPFFEILMGNLGNCPNYGSSDCPITMKEDKECNSVRRENLIKIMAYRGRR